MTISFPKDSPADDVMKFSPNNKNWRERIKVGLKN